MAKSFITTFTYDCEVSFNNAETNTATEILKECVKYLLIEHDYAKRVMPVIYLKVNLTPSLYNTMVPQQGKSKIFLNLTRTRKQGSTSSCAKSVIRDEFEYYMTDDPNSYKEMDTIGEKDGSAYKLCYIGLIKSDLTQKNKKSFEGIYKNTNMVSLVQEATKDMDIIIQPFVNNTNITNFACPSVSTIGQFLQYLNQQYSFYSGSYIYYLDFDKTYLRSNDGAYIDAKDGDHKYVAFDIRDMTNYNSLSSGMVDDESQDAYVIFIESNNAQVSIDRVTSELNGQITNVSNGSVQETTAVDTSAITSIETNISANTIITTTDPNGASNVATQIAENSDTLIVTKADMDARVFSPNKQYMLSYYEDNPSYCGIYYLVKKQEIYLRNGDQMSCQMTITMKKSADFVNTVNTGQSLS